MPLQAGDILHGQYQIRRGGFGYVYHARDVHEDVAIKQLIPGLVGDEAMLRRFLAEAKDTMRLSHEHIARTHTVFLEDGNCYIVMECMVSDSLEFCLRPFLFPEERGWSSARECQPPVGPRATWGDRTAQLTGKCPVMLPGIAHSEEQ